jgi:hypothetical protein
MPLVRDVGVAGSNPVTPTINSKIFFGRFFPPRMTFENPGGEAGGEIQTRIPCSQRPRTQRRPARRLQILRRTPRRVPRVRPMKESATPRPASARPPRQRARFWHRLSPLREARLCRERLRGAPGPRARPAAPIMPSTRVPAPPPSTTAPRARSTLSTHPPDLCRAPPPPRRRPAAR